VTPAFPVACTLGPEASPLGELTHRALRAPGESRAFTPTHWSSACATSCYCMRRSTGWCGMTQQEIASHLGTTREVIARALGQLASAGHVETSRNRIAIYDPIRLAKEVKPPNSSSHKLSVLSTGTHLEARA